jgi:DNA polymerase III delta prime subunit
VEAKQEKEERLIIMNIKRAKQEIKDTIRAYLMKDEYGDYELSSIQQRPILLIGPPGVGKTQIMEQISQECQVGLVAYTITHHTRQSAIGLPFIERRQFGGKEYAATEYTMSEIVASVYNKIEQTGISEGILFIDEINCVSETLAPAMLQFLQGKAFGNHKLPKGWIIVAAGNPPEYNKSVREFDIVTLDRIRRIDIEPDFGAWKEYAAQTGIHPAVRSYLNVRQQNFCRLETMVDGKMFATPRGWEDLARLIEVYERLGQRVDREIVSEYIQFPKIARDFASYLELYHKYQDDYQVERILEGKIPEGLYDKLEKAAFDERISVVGLLLSGLNRSFGQVCQLRDRLSLQQKKLRELKETEAFGVREREKACGQEEYGEPKALAAAALSLFAHMLEDFRGQWEKKQENGLLSRMELKIHQEVSTCLEQELLDLQKKAFDTPQEIWQRMQQLFGEESDRYENLLESSGQKLENAFDFMEAAFVNGQEMVLFVTELNTGFYSLGFLQEYECDRYYEYNKKLLFSQEEQEILKLMKEQKYSD